MAKALPSVGRPGLYSEPQRVYPQQLPRSFEETCHGWLCCPGGVEGGGSIFSPHLPPSSPSMSYFLGATVYIPSQHRESRAPLKGQPTMQTLPGSQEPWDWASDWESMIYWLRTGRDCPAAGERVGHQGDLVGVVMVKHTDQAAFVFLSK